MSSAKMSKKRSRDERPTPAPSNATASSASSNSHATSDARVDDGWIKIFDAIDQDSTDKSSRFATRTYVRQAPRGVVMRTRTYILQEDEMRGKNGGTFGTTYGVAASEALVYIPDSTARDFTQR